MLLWLAAIGLVSMLGQVVLLRELAVAFYGSELVFILALGIWLLWTAIGATLGRRARAPRETGVRLLFLVFALVFPLLVTLTRGIRIVFGGIPGAYLPFPSQLLAMNLVLLPSGLLLGLLFQWAAKLRVRSGGTLASAYAIESAGGIAGGILATLLPGRGVPNLAAALLCALAALGAAVLPWRGRPRGLERGPLRERRDETHGRQELEPDPLTPPGSPTSEPSAPVRQPALLAAPDSPPGGTTRGLRPGCEPDPLNRRVDRSNAPSRGLLAVAAAAGALLLGGLVFSPRLDRAMTRWTHPDLVAARDTPYGRVTVEKASGQVSVFENDALSFESEGASAEELAHLAAVQRPSVGSVLVLGGGQEGLVREVLLHRPTHVDDVEVDAALFATLEPFLPETIRRSFEAGNVSVITGDPRRVLAAGPVHDLILVGPSEPDSGRTNRLFTREFFALCELRLRPDGVLALRLRGSENLWTPLQARRVASIHAALRSVFADVVVLPGATNVLLASQTPLSRDPEVLSRRLTDRGVAARLVVPPYIRYLYTNDRFFEIESALAAGGAPPNTDRRPICYQYTLRLWLSRFFPSLGRTARGDDGLRGLRAGRPIAGAGQANVDAGRATAGVGRVAAAANRAAADPEPASGRAGSAAPELEATGLRLGPPAPEPGPAGVLGFPATWLGWALLAAAFVLARRRPLLRPSLLAAAAGFAGMVLETAIILNYQTIEGILYQDIGLLITLFMTGLALGAGAIDRLAHPSVGIDLASEPAGAVVAGRSGAGRPADPVLARESRLSRSAGRIVAGSLAGLGVLAAALLRAGLVGGLLTTAALLLACGALVAATFACASLAPSLGGSGQRRLVSPLYASDLLGGCAGSVASSLFLIPVLGLDGSAVVVVLLMLAAVILA